MDQFASIRAKARALRSDAAIPDNLPAIAVARKCAQHRGLCIRELDPSNPELEGSHGLLDRQFKDILIRKGLPDEEAAEIIAHEIGHFDVHDGPEKGYHPRSEANGGDPNQRIETYGIKERREAQANSFGRELILPRPLAKCLFLAGKRATAISQDLGVRYETTLQQLADSLLSPDLAPTMDAPVGPQEPCNPSQTRAVKHRHGAFLLRAGPGTGKTKTLTARVVALIEDGVAPSNILALTFSNKAAMELSERVQKAAGPKAINVWT